jgi:ribokinase
MLSALKSRGVRTATAPLREGVPTGEAWIFLADDGSNFIAVHPGANGAVQRGDIADARLPFDQAAILLLQMEIAPEANREAARRARKAGIPVLLNYAPADFFDPELLKVADILVVNETEAERLAAQCPGRLTEDRIPQIRDLGPGIILVTFGSDGSRLITPGSDTRIPAYAVTPTDTTAAGDTFCGALAARFAETGCLDHDSVEFASAAAALSVTRPGAMDSVPVRPEIDDFLRRQRGI